MTNSIVTVVAIFALLVAVVVFAPLALIWAINTLFVTNIPYTLTTWAASLIISSIFGANGVKRKG
jgi:hypothetical protein